MFKETKYENWRIPDDEVKLVNDNYSQRKDVPLFFFFFDPAFRSNQENKGRVSWDTCMWLETKIIKMIKKGYINTKINK